MKKSILSIAFVSLVLTLSAQIPTNNLLLHYQFNNNVDDESNNQFDGINNGAVSIDNRANIANRAYDFNGTSTYIEVPNESLLKPDFPFTISLWFNIDAINSTSKCLFASDEDNNKYSGFWLSYRSDQKISAGYGNGVGLGPYNRVTKHSTTIISTNSQWHHVVARFNGLNDIDLFIDCVNDPGTYSGSASEMVNLGNTGAIGRNLGHNSDSYHDGGIDDIRLYERALTNSEILALCREKGDVLSVKEVILNDKIDMYPNPTKGMVTVKGDDVIIGSNITIYNTIGQEIYNSIINATSTTIDLKSLGNSGMYFIRVSKANTINTTKKIILD